LRDDLAAVFDAGRATFEADATISGEELYDAVVALAGARGWEYGNWHCGHLVGEFPHEDLEGDRLASRIARGNHQPLPPHEPSGRLGHWILEVHLVDRRREIGGFYEQLLTL